MAALRQADGVILASPGYHGAMSGQMKNAIDYVEDLSQDKRPYLSDRAVGCLATAAGWRAAIATLTGLRSVVHALRGWPTPLGVAINTTEPTFDTNGDCVAPQMREALKTIAAQVLEFARREQGVYKQTGLDASNHRHASLQ